MMCIARDIRKYDTLHTDRVVYESTQLNPLYVGETEKPDATAMYVD